MREKGKKRVWGLILLLLVLRGGTALAAEKDCPYKVYMILGFHTNFYHSWRGDTPDEAGFGTDIRVVREILRILDEANAQGLDARGYWEGESLFTFEDIIPKYAPDILAGIQRRIASGLDEFMPAPYSNTLFSAVTREEMQAVVRWALSNPWGSGAKDLFGGYVPLLRPQEGMVTTGQIPLLKEEGLIGLVLAYSSYSFTTFSNFVPVLPPEQRYHFTRVRFREEDPPFLLFPCVSAADFVNYISCECWLLDLRKLQTSGQVQQDLVLHVNFDADAETWLPLVPPSLDWIPNAGGLWEYIRAVNKYDWAEFTLPSIYLKEHEPVGEVLIRQDLADGGWDGNYSWAEKYPSHQLWTALEQSRLFSRRALALASQVDKASAVKRGRPGEPLRGDERPGWEERLYAILYEGRDSSFFHRLRGLSTTHFGMSTPLINEERQAVAEKIINAARSRAEEAERLAAEALVGERTRERDTDELYSFLVVGSTAGAGETTAIFHLLRLPLILEEPLSSAELSDEKGNSLSYSLVNLERLGEGKLFAELMIPLRLSPGESRQLSLKKTSSSPSLSSLSAEPSAPLSRLKNKHLEIIFSEEHGITSLSLDGREFAGPDFLRPFLTYQSKKKPQRYETERYKFVSLEGEQWREVQRARLKSGISFSTPGGEARAELLFTFTLPEGAPFVIVDVNVCYPYTEKKDLLRNVQQHLRRWLDLRWIEVGPFELHPRLKAERERPLKVWKHNYLGITSWYELNYGQINPRNANLDSFNHHITAGWVAVSDRSHGLLLAECADRLSCFAFCPMRLREKEGRQEIWLNPFGSYYGRQMDYDHLGGNGLGAEIAETASSALRPNGPSYNGMKQSFSLLLAPYEGDAPPPSLQSEARAFFYPPAVVYVHTPPGVEARLRQEVERLAADLRRKRDRGRPGPLPPPQAFLVNPTGSAVDVVWDEPDDARIDGYELQWREEGETDWHSLRLERARRQRIENLSDGRRHEFRLRSVGTAGESEWTDTLPCTPGPVSSAGILSNAAGIKLSTILKTWHYINVHLLITP